ncbi:WD40-repeat-containing domain protein [Scheffersomyces amazonensis]|uniref:WD40-repeat-containing domain protein n=1 Tax=Scheffersomyces amazonensis TaxID=1078765 RepID=UPI00315DF6E7
MTTPVQERIAAFPDGNSLVSIEKSRLVVGNSEGLVKIYDLNQPDLEPKSVDIENNLTYLIQTRDDFLFITNTSGLVEVVDLSLLNQAIDIAAKTIYRSELALRTIQPIPMQNKVAVGGDDKKLVILNINQEKREFVVDKTVELNDSIVDLSLGDDETSLIISLANGDVKIFDLDVDEDEEAFIFQRSHVVPIKIHTSIDNIDYVVEHSDELVSTRIHATSNGDLIVPNINSIKILSSVDYSDLHELDASNTVQIVSTHLTPDTNYLAVLYVGGLVKVFDLKARSMEKSFAISLADEQLAINVQWSAHADLFFGTTNGEIVYFKGVIDIPATSNNNKNGTSLFLDEEAEDSAEEAFDNIVKKDKERVQQSGEDSMIIDEDDDDDNDIDLFGDDVHPYKRHKSNKYSNGSASTTSGSGSLNYSAGRSSKNDIEDLQPFSPGATPWILDSKHSAATGSVQRRYLGINSIGYVWAVRNLGQDIQSQHVTVSFYDRSSHKDYHFTDHFRFDLCSFNQRGLLLGYSGINERKSKGHIAKIYYRHHDTETDSWEKNIPLLPHEVVTSICVSNSNNAIITVGTSFGYLRFFNLYGVCINVLKVNPVYALVSSSTAHLFTVNQISPNIYTYSLIDINQDYKYIQQDVLLPLKRPVGDLQQSSDLIKGIFFNEFNDPCLVSNYDDTLMILQSWRDCNNSKWVPILNCHNVITEYGTNSNKKNWKCWPLGLFRDQLHCLILKNNNAYPGFPLALPIELEIRLPIQVYIKSDKGKKSRDILEEDEEEDELLAQDNEQEDEAIKELFNDNDPEENFLRSLTMGKIVSDSLNDDNITLDDDENDEIMERLTKYSILFDKSLLKLFADSCKDSKLNRALSIARLIKTDKALLAASKIAERMEFLNLSTKIGKLRDELLDDE